MHPQQPTHNERSNHQINQHVHATFQKLNVQVPNAGYYNVGLPATEVTEGDEIVVELEVTNTNYYAPITVDKLGDASVGKAFYKDQNGIWQPFSDKDTKQDPGIRLRTMTITDNYSKIFLPLVQR